MQNETLQLLSNRDMRSNVRRGVVLKSLLSPAFLLVITILAAAAIGMNSAVQAMGVYFKKEPVPLRAAINSLPKQIGPYFQINVDVPLESNIEHTLGTKDYLNRFYVDTRLLDPRVVKDLASTDPAARDAARLQAQSRPEALVYFHMAYYTGLVDTVAHIPENCMVGGGFDPQNPETVTLPLAATPGSRLDKMRIKYIEFTQRSPERGMQAQTYNVGYFFAVNGKYESDALTGVRQELQSLTQRFGYYCKFEMKTFFGANRAQEAQDRIADFLSFLMPEAEKILPDWSQVTRPKVVSEKK